MDDPRPGRTAVSPCMRSRLAESDVATVDLCDCGMIHLHMGPFSVRMAPDALRCLVQTLASAIGASLTPPQAPEPVARRPRSVPRGEA